MLGKLLQGRYQVVQVLSAGGFCQTYLAQDTRRPGNSTYVVKYLKPVSNHPDSLETQRRLFIREVQALKKLGNYDRVPQLVDHFEENNEFYLVQEFIEGHPLIAELKPGNRWTESQVVQLLQEVVVILEFIHSYGLIHRDIKPSNLIRRKQDGSLVLIDFGSVKQAWTQVVTAQGKTSASLALGIPATIAIGTPGYMPTEQGRGRPRPNSDIYALGMIGIQALTGLCPTQLLEDSETGELLWQHHAQVSAELAYILNKMVHYHFKDRYQSATEVLHALRPLVKRAGRERELRELREGRELRGSAHTENLSGQSPPASSVSSTPPPLLPSPNKSALLIGIGTGVAAALALMVGSYYFLRPTAPASKAQEYPVSIPSKNTALGNITLTNTLTGHSDVVWSVATSPDNQTLVSSSGDSTIKLWNLRSGELLRTLSGHSDQVLSVALSPDGQTLVSSSWDSTIKIWNLRTGELLDTVSRYSNEVWSLAISPDGRTLASGSGDTIKIWNLRTRKPRRTLSGHSDTVWSVAISSDGQTLASGSKDSTIKIWNLRTGELLHTLIGHSGRIRSVAISPDGQTLASGSWDSTIKLWNLRTGELQHTLSGHSAYVNSVALSPDGQILASGSDDYKIKLWNLRTGELLGTVSGHSNNVNSVAFDADGKILVSGSGDKTIKTWRL